MTEIFDQARALSDIDTNDFELANANRDAEAAAATNAPADITAPN